MFFLKKFIIEAAKGMLIGIANVIPGVSGGTMMVSMGIYDMLIHSITHLFKEFKKSILFLLPYVIGILIAIVAFSFLFSEVLFPNYPLQTSAAFVGLILGGLPVILRRINFKKVKAPGAALCVIFFAIIILLQVFGSGVENNANIQLSVVEVIKLMFIGMIASATMVIPGVSGSMMLMLMGYYNPVISSVSALVKGITSFDGAVIMQNIGILLPFGIGIVVGIFAIAKLIEVLISKWEGYTYCAILGLVTASPVVILMSVNYAGIEIGFVTILASVITFAAGFALAFLLDKFSPKEELKH